MYVCMYVCVCMFNLLYVGVCERVLICMHVYILVNDVYTCVSNV